MKTWLFRPFEFIAGYTALFIGLGIMTLTAIVCAAGNIHLDGVIDLHAGSEVGLGRAFFETALNWLSFSLFLYIAGMLTSLSSIRILDVYGTQALARAPLIIPVLATMLVDVSKVNAYLQHKLMNDGQAVTLGAGDILTLGLVGLLVISCVIWTIVLMYRAYSISCNLKGKKAVISFIACLLLAEGLTKLYTIL